ncbi:MAG: hypothetical protein Q8P48_07415 [Deltaproteobacteria bacterium]|nr:hypothetical protein [Deltaproteobacteria bacterium]
MTIQIKRGSSASRPNPLLNGEFGWDSDTRRLWIGNGVANENLLVAGAAVSTDFSVYVCTAALGGGAADADGLVKNSGTATATTANKLVDYAASFDSSYVNKTVYNKTDDTWAKITAVDDANTLTLSAGIMAVGEDYETANAYATVPLGFAAVPGPYSANVTLRISPGTFTEAVTFIGKIAAGSKTLTVAGSSTGTTTITGAIEISQKITINNIPFSDTTINANYGAELTWANCPLSNVRLNTRNGSDLTWDNCDGSGTTRLYTYIGSKNLIENTAITVGNNPESLTSINSTITKGYTMYVATTALGGNDAVADGLAITSGSATSTTANKLVDSAANFTSALVGKTVYNSTGDTWAKVDAVDSATQLSLSADIMASGEAYVIADAFSTITGALSAVPGLVNCNTTIKICNGTFTETVTVQGKAFSGPYELRLKGTLALQVSAASATVSAGTGATQGTVTKTGSFGSYDDKLAYFVTNDQYRLIDSDTADVLTLVGTAPSSTTQTVTVYDWATIIDGGASDNALKVASGQVGVVFDKIKCTNSATAAYVNRVLWIYPASIAAFYECWIYRSSGGYAAVPDGGKLELHKVLVNSAFAAGVLSEFGNVLCWYSKIALSGSGKGLSMSNSFCNLRAGSIIHGCATGIEAQKNGVFNCGGAASEGYPRIRNCATGASAATGGQITATVNNQYSGNTTNESADAASYGYID